MKKEVKTELWQLKMGLFGLIDQLNDGIDHLNTLTCKTPSRALDLDHQLGEFTCLFVDGQEWRAVCIKGTE